MSVEGIHRHIEQHAATRGDAPAVVEAGRSVSFRELNQRANVVARRLMASGFRRRSLAIVKKDKSLDTIVLLLAVLKAGGAYMWIDPTDPGWPAGVSFVPSWDAIDARAVALDDASLLAAASQTAQTAPNLPIVTRGADIACALPSDNGDPAVLVPHETLTALRGRAGSATPCWTDDAGAFDVWIPLMGGVAVTVGAAAAEVVAA